MADEKRPPPRRRQPLQRPPQESLEVADLREGPYPVFVQQYHRDVDRRPRRRAHLGHRRRLGLSRHEEGHPFAAGVTAKKVADRAVQLGVKQVAVFIQGPGTGPGDRGAVAWVPPVSWSSALRTSRRCRTTAAARPKRGESSFMARYTDAVCKLCRREQQKLFLKGDKCYTKCVLEKRPGIPGMAKPQRGKALRLLDPPAREAEAAPHDPDERAPVRARGH